MAKEKESFKFGEEKMPSWFVELIDRRIVHIKRDKNGKILFRYKDKYKVSTKRFHQILVMQGKRVSRKMFKDY